MTPPSPPDTEDYTEYESGEDVLDCSSSASGHAFFVRNLSQPWINFLKILIYDFSGMSEFETRELAVTSLSKSSL
jgi:hypothetical protein